MKITSLILIFGVVCACLLAAGCTQTPATPATPTPTPVPTTQVPVTPLPTTPVVMPTLDYIEGPLPTSYTVAVDVVRNTVSTEPDITVTFRGGKGINFVSQVEAVVTGSDGVVTSKTMNKPAVNDNVVIMGTRGTDRVEVFVRLVNGERYKIYDQELAFRSFN